MWWPLDRRRENRETGSRRPRAAPAASARTRRRRTGRRRRQGGRTPARSLLLARLVDLLLDLRLVDAFAVPLEGALPRGDGLVRAALLQPQIAEVILDDGVLRQLAGGGA